MNFLYYVLNIVKQVVHWFSATIALIQNREVGWATVDRKTGKFKREQQPIYKKLKLWFLFSRPIEWIDRTQLMRKWIHDKSIRAGKKEATKGSHEEIKSFVEFYGINMNDFTPSNIEEYGSFEDFFVRKHKKDSRPVFDKGDPTKAVVVAYCRLVVYDSVEKSKKLWIKGKHFTIGNLIEDDELAKSWHEGAIASFRLSPQDYHRYSSPVSGTVRWFKRIPGEYYQVDPLCVRSSIDILTSNARCALCIESKEFGEVLFVAIGATDVGTVEINEKFQTAGTNVEKGEEIGLFQYGGSSIIVGFEGRRIKFDEDLENLSRHLIMTDVEVGMSLGEAIMPPA